ncbi:MAG: very short patch repair endonuclease [Deltaproteobacteria bacterium]|nr:very short patch repair endonuclease [Deltaproteobacteria bacterium]
MARRARLRKTTREGHEIVVDDTTSTRMANIRRVGTKPELVVRKILSGLGLRYRLSNRDLPGTPDLANRRHAWAVFVHGCFWHRHRGCRLATTPKRNREFWQAKFDRNIARDRRVIRELKATGYDVVVIWECQTKRPDVLGRTLSRRFA